ncbi:MAG: T9SS type A sorting domain-containing protein, partial [Bacteroidetes bacterium]|nr:T9SS type A sorting domain-containing protein [Bacteroidota bacterium]
YVMDISVSLESPGGVIIELTSANGGNGDNYGINDSTCTGFTNFNMEGSDGNITAADAPFLGSFVPEGDFDAFNDSSSVTGTWILYICDDFMTDIGTLEFFEITFNAVPANFLSFGFAEETSQAIIDSIARTIVAEVEWETDLSSLVADFTLSPGATASIAGTAQESGITSNDFTYPVIYTVTDITGTAIFDWTVTVSLQPPPQGAVCSNPIPLILPASGITGTTAGFGDNYNSSMACTSGFMEGDDIVFQFTVPCDGTLSGALSSPQSWIGLFILDDCPDAGASCILKKTSIGSALSFTEEPIAAGTYFLIISSHSTFQSIDYTFDLFFFDPLNTISMSKTETPVTIFPNPGDGRFTVSLAGETIISVGVEILDVRGRIVYGAILENIGEGRFTINASGLTDGLYALRVRTPETILNRRVIIRASGSSR